VGLYEDSDMDSSNNPKRNILSKNGEFDMRAFSKGFDIFKYTKTIFYLTFYEVMFYAPSVKV